MNSHPTLTVVLNPPAIAGCQPQLVNTASVTAAGVQKYTLQLSGFTLQTACGLASASAALATGVQSVHVQILGSNFQYTTDAAKCTATDTASNCYPNGLNLGKITFN